MSDLTRAIAEALWQIDDLCPHPPDEHAEGTCDVCDMAFAAESVVQELGDALAPLIEARVREARADALAEAADAWTQGAWASTPRHKDRVADRMAASQYAGDWMRERAEEVRRGE